MRCRSGVWSTQACPKVVEGLHAVTDAEIRPPSVFMAADRVSDDTGVAALFDDQAQ